MSLGIATLLELFDGDRRSVAELLAAARTAIEANSAAIEHAAARAEFAIMCEAAHRLKGTSSSIGAQHLIELATRLEAAARGSALSPSSPALVDLRLEVAAVSAEIAAFTLAPTIDSNGSCHDRRSPGV